MLSVCCGLSQPLSPSSSWRSRGRRPRADTSGSLPGGKSFGPWTDAGYYGFPSHALRLADDRVLLVYGYRQKPYGIRARILDAECTNAAEAREFVLRDDGGSGDDTLTGDAKRALYFYQRALSADPEPFPETYVAALQGEG